MATSGRGGRGAEHFWSHVHATSRMTVPMMRQAPSSKKGLVSGHCTRSFWEYLK